MFVTVLDLKALTHVLRPQALRLFIAAIEYHLYSRRNYSHERIVYHVLMSPFL
jgi:hypothetical protein